ncbi:uncharacterized protein LOC129582338 [Paramacrobiotus metropolitanus]|uniref:uncharacterized protein LOC129582338 n=1 Tax=Paramacrobiotus metropolitanus TaxID=2943436 RepID=UPI00244659B5|nr:uncharacterized protein LOC129582338 [Paramacrobiotus metropolitanus]
MNRPSSTTSTTRREHSAGDFERSLTVTPLDIFCSTLSTMPSRMDLDTAVNVLGKDQRLRFGHVVDVADDRLFVDLLGPHRRREYAPFGSVALTRVIDTIDLKDFHAQQGSVVPVRVLVPETPAGPWMWSAGEMVVGSMGYLLGGGYVRWHCPHSGVPCTDFVPTKRLRPVTDAVLGDTIGPGIFIKGHVQLGEEFRSLSTEATTALVNRLNGASRRVETQVVVIDFVDGELTYIHNRRDAEKCQVSEGNVSELMNSLNERLVSLIKSIPDEPASAADNSMAQMALPVELWQEVFSHLDTLTQTQLRTGCPTWNRIMDAPALRSTIVIRREVDYFLCLATVGKCLRSDTQRVAITYAKGVWDYAQHPMLLCDIIRYVAEQRTGIHLRTVYLHGVRMKLLINRTAADVQDSECGLHPSDPAQPESNAPHECLWLEDLMATCRSVPCDAIHLTNCDVYLVGLRYAPQRGAEDIGNGDRIHHRHSAAAAD